jgi:hypothetical protein
MRQRAIPRRLRTTRSLLPARAAACVAKRTMNARAASPRNVIASYCCRVQWPRAKRGQAVATSKTSAATAGPGDGEWRVQEATSFASSVVVGRRRAARGAAPSSGAGELLAALRRAHNDCSQY